MRARIESRHELAFGCCRPCWAVTQAVSFNKLDLVLPGRDGDLWRPSAFASNCRTVFNKAALTCRLHDLRHTQATLLLRRGVHPKDVQERLGHANVSITLDIYSHCTANMQNHAALKIDAALAAALAG